MATQQIHSLLQETEGVVVAKVLKLDECVLAITLHHRLHELIDEAVICLTRHSLVSVANIKLILQQLLKERKE